jgi:hypothetical protein
VGTDVGVGDSELPFLIVSPADGSTAVTLEVRPPPPAAPYPLAMTGGDLEPILGTSPADFSQRWDAVSPAVFDEAGKWVFHWTVTGTGEGSEDLEVYVVPSPVAGGPTWAPGRSRVANYLPHRTLASSAASIVESDDVYELTFDSTTRPTGLMVSRLIADGVAWVSAKAPNLSATLHDAAAVCVVLFAAAMIERSWPNDDQSLQRANDLEKRLDIQLKDLADANEIATGTGDYGLEVVPVWSFPPAPCTPYPYY